MTTTNSVKCFFSLYGLLTAGLMAQAPQNYDVPLKNWAAPSSWQPVSASHGQSARAIPASLMFVAMTPCRVVDTRASQSFPAPFGAPSLVANATRSFPITNSACSVPPTAQAYSFNVTVIPPGPLGYLTMWPTGLSQPNAVTLDDITGDIRNNAAIVPAGTPSGSVDVHVNAATDLVIDINGYYTPSSGQDFSNIALGYLAFRSNLGGAFNAAFGDQALASAVTANGNTAIGFEALDNSLGNLNSALGFEAGLRLKSGSNNLYLGNPGMDTESNTIRVGTGGGDILDAHTRFFVAAVRGVATGVGDAVSVMIDSHGQLGTINSSRRFKEDIQDMGEMSSDIVRLRPVTYRYSAPYEDGSKPVDYGLIAEEVAAVYPDLVVKNADGQIETVQYHKLTPMLLNELQKEHRKQEIQDQTIQALQAQVSALQKGLESLVAK